MNELADRIYASRVTGSAEPAVADASAGLADAELMAAAAGTAAAVRRACVHPNPLVASVLPLGLDAVVLLVAAITEGFSVCFLDPAAMQARRDQVLAAVGPDAIVDRQAITPVNAASGSADGRDDAEPGYVAMSSGSTSGGPKGVLSSWSALGAFVVHGADALELDVESIWAEVSHLSYDMAMTNLLLSLASGARLRVSGALSDRLRPLRFMERVSGTHVRLAPRFIDLAVAERRPSPPSLRVWGSGGDRLFGVQVDQVFELGIATVVNTYGTSESGGFASAARFTSGTLLHTEHGSVTIGSGRMGPWQTILSSLDGQSMLSIRSPHLSSGYFFGASGTGYPRWDRPDLIVTGDLGAQAAGGLYCQGRSGRRVKRNGSFVDLDEIDAMLRSESSVGAFSVMTPDGELLSLVEAPKEQVLGLQRRLPSVLRPDILPDHLVAVRQLPRLANGKVDHVAASLLAHGASGSS